MPPWRQHRTANLTLPCPLPPPTHPHTHTHTPFVPEAYKTILRTGNTAGKSPWLFGQIINKAGLPVFEVDESGHPTDEPRISNSPDFSSLIETYGPFGARKLFLITHFEAPSPAVQASPARRSLPRCHHCRPGFAAAGSKDRRLAVPAAGQPPRTPALTIMQAACLQYVVELGQAPDGTLTPRNMKVRPAGCTPAVQVPCWHSGHAPLAPSLAKVLLLAASCLISV